MGEVGRLCGKVQFRGEVGSVDFSALYELRSAEPRGKKEVPLVFLYIC